MEDLRPLTVTLIQTGLFWEDRRANLDMFEKKIRGITSYTEVVILPEMFSTGFSMNSHLLAETMDGETVTWMRGLAASRKVIITGSLIIEEKGRYFNRLIWMLPNGEMGIYDKRHLFGFAGEHDHYCAGDKKLIASLKGWKINLQICYDLRFPVWTRQPVEEDKKYDVLVNVANWPDKRRNGWQSLLTARAIENQAYVIGVNRTGADGNDHHYAGDSMIIDPLGTAVYHKEQDEDIFTFTLRKEPLIEVRRKFPFLRDADNYIIRTN